MAPLLRAPSAPPVVVDLGFGASPVTVLELAARLRRVRPDVRVLGVEIDPGRVARGLAVADPPAVDFVLGGFEVPVPGGGRPVLVRAFNVLRQYDEAQVAEAWGRVVDRLAPGGALVEGTCDEPGRLAAWVDVRRDEEAGGAPSPRTLTLAWRLAGLERPSVVAERLPKVLIHRNVPGEPVHALMQDLDRAWARHAPLGTYGARQRFVAVGRELVGLGWPVEGGPARWRLGELTVAWRSVAPADGQPRV